MKASLYIIIEHTIVRRRRMQHEISHASAYASHPTHKKDRCQPLDAKWKVRLSWKKCTRIFTKFVTKT